MSASQHRQWVESLARQAYLDIFALLDDDPWLTGDEAGRIATCVEAVVREELRS